MAGHRVRPQAAGTRLPTPVERGDVPAAPVPMVERLEILLVGIAAARQEQQAAARAAARRGPVDPADGVAVRRQPPAFTGMGGNGAAVERSPFSRSWMANSSLLPVVTI